MDPDKAERDTSESGVWSGHGRPERNLVLLRRGEMMVNWAEFYNGDGAKQRQECILKVELIELAGELEEGLKKMLRKEQPNFLDSTTGSLVVPLLGW